jgi:hypothetical protein
MDRTRLLSLEKDDLDAKARYNTQKLEQVRNKYF